MPKLLIGFLCFINFIPFAQSNEVKADKEINSIGIVGKINKNIFKNLHYKVLGICVWQKSGKLPKILPELEHFFPDLVVTVYNRPGTNPWLEVRTLLENKQVIKAQEKTYKALVGFSPSYGSAASSVNIAGLHRKHPLVDVLGSPYNLLSIPFITLRPETTPLRPYYLALNDLIVSRLQVIEIALSLRLLPYGAKFLLGFPIGTGLGHWGYEIPRHFITHTNSKFRAAMVAAMQGADLVTNINSGHLLSSTSNSCGKNCVIENVAFDNTGKKILWQEVFPKNRMIKPGEEGHRKDEITENLKGKGNYVFVVWRKYRGCVQGQGKLIYKTKKVGLAVKR